MEGFTVTQFHHTEWPHDGRPKTGTLIEMLDMITKCQMSTGNRPITVMCKYVLTNMEHLNIFIDRVHIPFHLEWYQNFSFRNGI